MMGAPSRKIPFRCTKQPIRERRTRKRPREEMEREEQDDGMNSRMNVALSTGLSDVQLLCRDEEISQIKTFLHERLARRKPGSMYVSGPPGTGKTACVQQVLEEMKDVCGVKCTFLNCMEVTTEQLKAAASQSVVLVVDELDSLESNFLYKLFEYPTICESRLILIGIANALDLTERVLPRMQSRAQCRPVLLHFNPYTKEQIETILQARLKKVHESQLDDAAIEFCARKVAAMTGDIRKALHMCRRAVEIQNSRPSKSRRVAVADIVLSDLHSKSSLSQPDSFPLQQKLVMSAMLLILREKKLMKETTLGNIFDRYRGVCHSQKVDSISQSDFVSVCSLLEVRGIFAVGKGKEVRQRKVRLHVLETELHRVLGNEVLVHNILA